MIQDYVSNPLNNDYMLDYSLKDKKLDWNPNDLIKVVYHFDDNKGLLFRTPDLLTSTPR